MNKFTKALLLALVFAAPVAISAPAVQASTVTSHNRVTSVSADKATTKKPKKGRRKKKGGSMQRSMTSHARGR